MTDKGKQGSGLFIALLAIIFVAPTQWGAEIKGIRLTPVEPLLGLAFAYWAVQAVRRRAEWVIPPTCLWAVVGVSLVSALSAHRGWVSTDSFNLTNNTLGSLVNVVQLVEYLLVAYVVAWVGLNNERQARTAGLVFVGATALVVLLGVVQYLRFVSATPVEDYQAGAAFYLRSTFSSRHVYGGFLAMALPVAFAMGLAADDRRLRVGLLALVVVGAVTILSPGPLLALVAVLLLVAWRTSARALQATLAGVIAFGAVTSVALPRNYQENFRAPLHFRFFDDADEGKQKPKAQWMEWLAGGHVAQEMPLLGVGPGNYQQNLAGAYTSLGVEAPRKSMPGPDARVGRRMEPDMNSLYVVTAASTGLLGLAALLWTLVYFTRTASAAARRVTDPGLRALALGVWGGIIAFTLTSVFNSLLVRGTGVTLVIFFAIAAVLRHRPWAASEEGARHLRVV